MEMGITEAVRNRIKRRSRQEASKNTKSTVDNCPDKNRGYDSQKRECLECEESCLCQDKSFERFSWVADDLISKLGFDLYCPITEGYTYLGETEETIDQMRDDIIQQVNQFLSEYSPEHFDILRDSTIHVLSDIIPNWEEYYTPQAHRSLFNHLDRYYDENFEEEVENISYVLDRKCDQTSGIRKKLVLGYKKTLENEIKLLKELFPKEFKKDGNRWPTSWMTKNKGIMINLDKRKHVLPTLNHLWKEKLGYHDSIALASKLNIGKHTANSKNKNYILTIPNRDDVAADLNISSSLVWNYLSAFEKAGFVKKFKKHSTASQMVYAIGYYNNVPDYGPNPVSFLANTTVMRRALRTFNPYIN